MFWVIMGTGILTMPYTVAQFTIRDGWITCLFFMIGGLICATVCWLFQSMFQNKSLTQALSEAFGPYLGSIANIWIAIWFFVTASTIVREFVVFTQENLLPKSPPSIISVAMLIADGIGVLLGLEVIGRLSEIITFLAILTSMFLVPMTLQNVDFHMLQPVLADGFSPILKGGVMPILGFVLETLIVLQIVPNLQKGHTLWRDILILGGAISIFSTINQVIIVGTLGTSTNYLVYPVLEVVRGIKIGHFIERLDTLYVLGIITTLFLKIVIFQYCFVSIIKHLTKSTSIYFLVWPATLVVLVGSMYLFKSSANVQEYMLNIAPTYFALTLVVIPVSAALIQWAKMKLSLTRK